MYKLHTYTTPSPKGKEYEMNKNEVEFLNALRKSGFSRSLCESVNDIRKAVFESEDDNTWLGIPGTRYLWHGEWADPEIIYKDISFDEATIIDDLSYTYGNEHPEDNSEEGFDDWLKTEEGKAEAKNVLDNRVNAVYENSLEAEKIVSNIKEYGYICGCVPVDAKIGDDNTITIKYDKYNVNDNEDDDDDEFELDGPEFEEKLNSVLSGTGWGVYDYSYREDREDYGIDIILKIGCGDNDMN